MATIPPPAFSLRDVRSQRAGAPVLKGVSTDLPSGRVSALVGPSGSGKTSLLRLLNRLDEIASGSIRVAGTDIREIPVRDLRRRIGLVFHEPAIFPGTVEQNIRMALAVAEWNGADAHERTQAALDEAQLAPDFLHRDARMLSGGERQRLMLARALALEPDALLLDEPTSQLDPDTAARVLTTIAEMSARRGITVVASMHRIEEARRVADFVVALRDGRVTAQGGAPQILDGSTGVD
ncbi:MAG: ABC transporter ATP-binding protein [Longimicrobiales bacterium]